MGRDLQRSKGQEPQIVLTLPLLEGLDGINNMSKSLGNSIGITESVNDIYGKVLSISDVLMLLRYYDLLNDLSSEEIAVLKANMERGDIHPKEVKKELARELTARFHSSEAAICAEGNYEKVFQKKGLLDEIPEVSVRATRHRPAAATFGRYHSCKIDLRRTAHDKTKCCVSERGKSW